MRYLFIGLLLLSAAAGSYAKPVPKPPPPPKPAPSSVEKVDPLDASSLKVAKLAWKLAETELMLLQVTLADKYHLDLSKGEGWDEQTLVIRRTRPEPKK